MVMNQEIRRLHSVTKEESSQLSHSVCAVQKLETVLYLEEFYNVFHEWHKQYESAINFEEKNHWDVHDHIQLSLYSKGG